MNHVLDYYNNIIQLSNSVNVDILPTDFTNWAGKVVGVLISHVCCRSAVSEGHNNTIINTRHNIVHFFTHLFPAMLLTIGDSPVVDPAPSLLHAPGTTFPRPSSSSTYPDARLFFTQVIVECHCCFCEFNNIIGLSNYGLAKQLPSTKTKLLTILVFNKQEIVL